MTKRSNRYKEVLKEEYLKKLQNNELEKVRLDKLITGSSLLRMAVFIGTLVATYFTYESLYLLLATLAVGFGTFLLLVVRHERLVLKRKFTQNLIGINQLELKALFQHPYDLDEGNEFIDPDHAFSHDIDLFGKGSFFQMINRTTTKLGKEKLADKLCQNDIQDIPEKHFDI